MSVYWNKGPLVPLIDILKVRFFNGTRCFNLSVSDTFWMSAVLLGCSTFCGCLFLLDLFPSQPGPHYTFSTVAIGVCTCAGSIWVRTSFIPLLGHFFFWPRARTRTLTKLCGGTRVSPLFTAIQLFSTTEKNRAFEKQNLWCSINNRCMTLYSKCNTRQWSCSTVHRGAGDTVS